MFHLPDDCDLMLVEQAFWLLARQTDNPAYDFPFASAFACRRPWESPSNVTAIARVGAPPDYDALFEELASQGILLINSPAQHRHGSELPHWYPLIDELTPKSAWFDEPPPASAFEDTLGWPVFVKGARQTSRHDPQKSIARDPAQYAQLVEDYQRDEILSWQRCVVRQFVKLRGVPCSTAIKIRPSFEFRTFWWQKQFVGGGPYWSEAARYSWTEREREECVVIAREAAERIDCPFLVVDMAQTMEGEWIVIECNDGQESGYAGVSPLGMWNEVIRLAREALP